MAPHRSNSQVDSLYIDFSKAFDSVSHTRVLKKIWNFGVREHSTWESIIVYLVASYAYRVSLKGPTSVRYCLIFLSTTLLTVFNMPDVLSTRMMSNYSKPIASVSNPLRLQDDLRAVSEWSADNRACDQCHEEFCYIVS